MRAAPVAEQLDLLSYSAPISSDAPRAERSTRRRGHRGLAKDVRIRVRGNSVRAADKGSVIEPFEKGGIAMVRYRSDRNGGVYDVRADRVSIITRPRIKTPRAKTEDEETPNT